MKTLVVANAQTELLAVKCSREYNPVLAAPGLHIDVVICSRVQQESLLEQGVIISPEEMHMCGGPCSAWLCKGDYLLDPETGDPILRVFKP